MPTNNTTAHLINYQSSERYQNQPFFGAGSKYALKWVNRKEGQAISSAALLYEKDLDIDNSSSYAIAGAGGSGIAGTTFYQLQAQLIKP